MPGILREVTEHALKIYPGPKQVKQRLCRLDEGKRRTIDEEKHRAIGEEFAKLLAVGFIKEVYHP